MIFTSRDFVLGFDVVGDYGFLLVGSPLLLSLYLYDLRVYEETPIVMHSLV